MQWWTLATSLLVLAGACTASATATPSPTPTLSANPTPTTSPTATTPPAGQGPNTPPEFLTPDSPDPEFLGPLTTEEEAKIQASFGEWRKTDFSKRTVPLTEVRFLGLFRDQIAPIYSPRFDSIAEADEYLEALEPVLVVEINGDARAYPFQMLIWHEVVNDTVGGVPVAPTY